MNVLSVNIALTACVKSKLSKHKLALRKFFDKQVPTTGKNLFTFQRGVSSSPFWQHYCPLLLVPLLPCNVFSTSKRTTNSRLLQREHANAPARLSAKSNKNSTPTLSGLSCALSIAKQNFIVMPELKITVYMKQIMLAAPIPQLPTADIQLSKPKVKSRRGTQTDVSTASFANADTHIRPS